jgi:hypothetical protein
MAGMQHHLHGSPHNDAEVLIELQPRPSLPMYFDPHVSDTDAARDITSIQEEV